MKIRRIGQISLIGLIVLAAAGPMRAEVNSAVDGVTYTGDGTTAAFTFPFGVLATSQVRVVLRTTATGAEELQTLNSHYTLTDDDADGDYTDGPGGTVTFVTAPPATKQVWITRAPALTQTRDLDSTGYLRLVTLEDGLDHVAYQVQYLRRLLYRALLIPETEGQVRDVNVPAAASRASGALVFDANGDVTIQAGVLDPAEVTVTPLWVTVLDDLTYTAALTSLGVDPNWTAVLEGPNVATDAELRTWKADTRLDAEVDVRDYGATGDGVTDDTTAVQAAIDAAEAAGGAVVYFPAGDYLCNISLDEDGNATAWAQPMLQGAGPNATQLKSAVAGTAVITMTGAASMAWTWTIRDLTIWGTKDSTCDSNGLEGPDEAAGWNLRAENVDFRYCNVAFHNKGCIVYTFENCVFKNNQIGIWLTQTTAGDNHGGCGYFLECNIETNYLAAIYVADGPSQVVFDKCVIENNPGLGYLVKNTGAGGYPTIFRDCWMESNGTDADATVIVDGTTYTLTHGSTVWTYGAWVNDGTVLMENLVVPPIKIEGRSFVEAPRCNFRYAQTMSLASTSIFTAPNATYYVTNTSGAWPNDYYSPGGMLTLVDGTSTGYDSNDIAMSWRTDPRNEIAWDKANLLTEGSCAVPFTVEAANGNAYSFDDANEAPIWGTCLKWQPAASQTIANAISVWTSNVSVTEDKWYLLSFDIKSVGEDGYVGFRDSSTTFFRTIPVATFHSGLPVVTDRWYRYVFVVQASVDYTITDWKFYNAGATDPNYLIADAQLVEFDTPQGAYEYLQRNAVAPSSNVSRLLLQDGDTMIVTKTIIQTIDLDDDASTDDYQFDDDAANTTEQVVTLTNILPAYAELTGWQIRCFEGMADANTATVQFGTSSGGTELADEATACDDTSEVVGTAAAAGPVLAATAAARSLYFAVTPSVNWNVMHSTGRWAVLITYTDYGAVYTQKNP